MNPNEMTAQSNIDLLAPALMLGAWLGGIIVALGHHLYYHHLDGSPAGIDQSLLGFHFSSQQLTAALGTSFAFVSRAFLIFATSVAYTQVFWRAARNPTKQNTLTDLDAMLSALSNLLAFGKGSVWKKHSLLLSVALTSWLLPIPFIIPPGTLSVVLVSKSHSVVQDVPNVDFISLNYVAGMPSSFLRYYDISTNKAYTVYDYNGPSLGVEKVAIAVAAQGAILPIDAPAENSSWAVDFYGPSLRCGVLNNSMQWEIEQNILEWLWGVTNNMSGIHNCDWRPNSYLGWNPTRFDPEGYRDDTVTPLPFVNATWGSNPFHTNVSMDALEFSRGSKQGPFTPLYIALFPRPADGNPCPHTLGQRPFGSFENASFFQCDLHNASYHVNFSYESGVQNISFQTVSLEAVSNVNNVISLEGATEIQSSNGCGFDSLPIPENFGCISDPVMPQRLSYTGILDAFCRLVTGSVSFAGRYSNVSAVDTDIFATSLIETPELEYLVKFVKGAGVEVTLQNQFIMSLSGGLTSLEEIPRRSSLPRVMEEMFSNITISLMSSNLLQPNTTSPSSPPPVNVNITTLKSVYSYSPASLWIAYGAAILAASLSLAVGTAALVSNDASYNSDFSTILRAAYGAVLSFPMKRQDAHGAAPLPKYLESVEVSWPTLQQQQPSAGDENNDAGNLANHCESNAHQNAASTTSEDAG